MSAQSAVILTNGLLNSMYAKTCHGLLRGTERYEIVGVIDAACAGQTTNAVVLGEVTDVPIDASVQHAIERLGEKPAWCIIGVAFEGGRLPDAFRSELLFALRRGISVVNGLHTLLSADAEMLEAADRGRAEIVDIRKPKTLNDLHFWTGKIKEVHTPRIAVLGMDCAVGKRTTCRMLMESLRSRGIKAEMIYTGQTGWLQGYPYGCIVDATLNDFVSGELEHAVYSCDQDLNPDLILIEGQSSLRNPSGPFGAELMLSVGASHVILQHDPRRIFFDDNPDVGYEVPSVASEIELIRQYGAEVRGIVLHPAATSDAPMLASEMEHDLQVPVVWGVSREIQRMSGILAGLHTSTSQN